MILVAKVGVIVENNSLDNYQIDRLCIVLFNESFHTTARIVFSTRHLIDELHVSIVPLEYK